jgi:preprotein translocase SecE subunit
MSRFTDYLRDTQAELKHVSWPTRKQAMIYTGMVVGISILVGLFTGFFDFVFTRGIDWFIGE